jgi:hypothetical protein
MRYIVILLVLPLIILSSCADPEAERAKQQAREDSLLSVQQDSLLDAFHRELAGISQSINAVSVRNGLLNLDTSEGAVLSKEAILKQVESLDGLLANNQKQLNDLYDRMRKSKVKSDELEKLVNNMQNRLSEREGEIDRLMRMLEDKDIVIEDIKANLDSMRRDNITLAEDIIQMDEEMHVVYFTVGEQRELIDKGIVTKEGGILGVGGSKRLDASNLDLGAFESSDQRDLTDIPLFCKKAKLITNHPLSSYEFIKNRDGHVEGLSIKDRKRFWSVSDFLVVEVSN